MFENHRLGVGNGPFYDFYNKTRGTHAQAHTFTVREGWNGRLEGRLKMKRLAGKVVREGWKGRLEGKVRGKVGQEGWQGRLEGKSGREGWKGRLERKVGREG